jgi:hypothetical protein
LDRDTNRWDRALHARRRGDDPRPRGTGRRARHECRHDDRIQAGVVKINQLVRPDAEAGTWILHGTALTKLSLYRLIDDGKGRDLLESEPVDPGTGYSSSSFCCTYVV